MSDELRIWLFEVQSSLSAQRIFCLSVYYGWRSLVYQRGKSGEKQSGVNRSRTSLSRCFVGNRSEISIFYTDVKEVTRWDLKPEIPRKEREGE